MAEATTGGQQSLNGDANSNLRLTATLLNENNYLSWARSVSLTLSGRGKIGYINGKIKKTEPPKEGEADPQVLEQWQMNNDIVCSWLLNSMEPSISGIFLLCDTAKDMWDSVKEMFGHQQNFAHIFQIKQEIAQIKQQNRSNTEYYGNLKKKMG
jgi:gag-polypeptide of LTR copia-type